MSDEVGVNFTPDAADAIVDTVRVVRGQPVDGTGRRTDRRQHPGDRLIKVKITSNAPGGEKYFGKSLTPRTAPVTSTGDLAEADFGTLADTEDVLFLNMDHMTDTSGHTLTKGNQTPLALGRFAGYTEESPSRMIVEGFSLNTVECDSETSAGRSIDGGAA